MEEAGDLHRFLRDLDHFQAWLTKTQTEIANEDEPVSLADAEKLLTQHQSIKEEIENYVDDYEKMMEYGERIFTVNIYFTFIIHIPVYSIIIRCRYYVTNTNGSDWMVYI